MNSHALLRHTHLGDLALTYSQEELVVESIALTVVGGLGLATPGYSIPYLTSCSHNDDSLDIGETCASAIDRLAKGIEDAIGDPRTLGWPRAPEARSRSPYRGPERGPAGSFPRYAASVISPTIRDESLARSIYTRAHLTGEFRLRSGALSEEYFDKYLFESDPDLLRAVAAGLVSLLPDDTQAVAGLELGGIPLATMVSQLSGRPALFVRKQAKDYGTCRLAEGGEASGQRLAVIEDVVTSGGQLIESCAALQDHGAEIAAVLCVIDREAGGADNLLSHGLELRSLFTMSQLRQAACT